MTTVRGEECRRGSREELRRELEGAAVLACGDWYESDLLHVTLAVTATAGTYYIVTEADVLGSQDCEALRDLGKLLGAPWRNRIIETDSYDHPHRRFPLSQSFQVHVVHPGVCTERELYDRQVFESCVHDALGIAG